MLQFEDARRIILEHARLLPVETVSLEEAEGRVLREAVVARTNVPPFSRSAMDGYALAIASIEPRDGVWELDLEGESRTGHVTTSLEPGKTQTISTGAEIPEGADAVIPHEQTERTERGIRSTAKLKLGQNIRQRGEDLEAGAEAMLPGSRLSAGALSLAASLDATKLVVSRRPRIRILCTGDELRAPGSADRPGSIAESISIGLRSMAMRAAATVEVAPYVADEDEATQSAVAKALEDIDLLITVGGVSVGNHDRVRPALESHGVKLGFWKVAIKPGKPVALGVANSGSPLVLCLPGNPASALVTFGLFGMPLLRAMQGDSSPLPFVTKLPLASATRHSPGRMEFVRARLTTRDGETLVEPLGNQSSGALTSIAVSDLLAILPAEVERLEAAETIEVIRWNDL